MSVSMAKKRSSSLTFMLFLCDACCCCDAMMFLSANDMHSRLLVLFFCSVFHWMISV